MTASAGSPPAEPPPAGPPRLAGYLEGVLGGRIVGWCCDPEQPSARLDVQAYVDGVLIGSACADLERESVARAGFGDGRHGFAIDLPIDLADGGDHRVAVRAGATVLKATPSFAAGERRAQAGEAWAATTFHPDTEPELPAPTPTPAPRRRRHQAPPIGSVRAQLPHLLGYVDGIVAGEIRGWVADPSLPGTSIPVEAFLDGILVGTSPADDSRSDVAKQGYGEHHGFRIEAGVTLDPGTYELEVRTAVTGQRVPLGGDYVVLGADGEAVDGVELSEPRARTSADASKPSRALLGTDGWLFEWSSTRAFNTLRGTQRLPGAVLERQLMRVVERHDLTSAAGAILIEAVIPSKLAVYDAQLPAGVAIDDLHRPAGELAAAVRDLNGVDVVDLTSALRHAKRHGMLYARTGVGLTWRGGFYAYRRLAKELAKRSPELEPLAPAELPLLELELERLPDSLTDLPRLAWVGSDTVPIGTAAADEPQEGRERLDWRRVPADYAVLGPELATPAGSASALLRRRTADRGIRALLIHDGCASPLLPFLSEHFDELLIVGTDADAETLIEAFGPTAVLEIVGEASLLH